MITVAQRFLLPPHQSSPALFVAVQRQCTLPKSSRQMENRMPTIMELRARGTVPYPRPEPPSTARPLSAFTGLRPTPATTPVSMVRALAHRRTEIPASYMDLEARKPLIVIDDNPVFDVNAAGRILGVTSECLKKWRQRNRGPDYLQYGKNGPVRYELSALMAFRAAHRVTMGSRP